MTADEVAAKLVSRVVSDNSETLYYEKLADIVRAAQYIADYAHAHGLPMQAILAAIESSDPEGAIDDFQHVCAAYMALPKVDMDYHYGYAVEAHRRAA